ncbi:putative sulfate/molybdate transporter [Parasediminibacterium sp. JCM 36343]|uniref:putative sulfate/molybdate transporter n=1 Tax=Parasediminibacterium sp. JCM 36343 TaxID=3374279 RepID=UPI00397C0CF4
MEETKKIKFNRSELSGAFGDIGTDFPLIVAMIIAAKLHTPSVLIMFGILQIATGLIYRMPMPVQPLKAMATIVITQKIAGNILLGAGLAIGLVMFLLSLTGLLDKLTKIVPKTVIRGIQMGLGISLCMLSCKEYLPADKTLGYILAFIAFVLILFFIDNKKYPVAILVILLGVLYAFVFKTDFQTIFNSVSINIPQFHLPTIDDVSKGFVLLALPQIPLSLGNSIMATKQVSHDFFPEREELSVKKIGLTYSFMNLIMPFFSGIPCCHGAGGMVGHYTFGGRTGGSVIMYGLFYIILGVFFGHSFENIIKVFPLPVLGVILIFEGLSLILLVRDIMGDRKNFVITVLVGIMAFGLPYGFAVSIIVGTLLYYLPLKIETLSKIGKV